MAASARIIRVMPRTILEDLSAGSPRAPCARQLCRSRHEIRHKRGRAGTPTFGTGGQAIGTLGKGENRIIRAIYEKYLGGTFAAAPAGAFVRFGPEKAASCPSVRRPGRPPDQVFRAPPE
jgi:hypothetical protein